MATKTAKWHREERARLITKAQELAAEHEDENGLLAADYQEQFDQMLSDSSDHLAAAKRKESLEALDRSMENALQTQDDLRREVETNDPVTANQPQKLQVRNGFNNDGSPRYTEITGGNRSCQAYHDAWMNYITTGDRSMTAIQSDNSERAGYLLASEQFAAGILKEVDDLLFIRRYARIHTVREAGSLGIRKRTARLSTWGWGQELEAPTADSALKYGKKVLHPHYAHGLVKVSEDLLRRSADIESEVQYEMGRDAGELLEDAYLTGNGNLRPLGVFTADNDGISTSRDVVTGSTTNFTFDGLINAKYTLKSQYRNGGGVRWMMHRDGISKVAKLKDSDNQPLFRVGAGRMQDGGNPEDMLLGFPVDESERSPNTFTNGNYVAMLCNWRYYEIADALDMTMKRLVELYAENNQVGFLAHLKTDGMPTLEEAFVRLKCGT